MCKHICPFRCNVVPFKIQLQQVGTFVQDLRKRMSSSTGDAVVSERQPADGLDMWRTRPDCRTQRQDTSIADLIVGEVQASCTYVGARQC